MEELLSRHKKEKKDLLSKIQSLKKNSGKKKKEVAEEISKLESELLKKHTEELANLNLNEDADENTEATAEKVDEKEDNESAKPVNQRISKAQKRRDKKAEKEKEREHLIQLSEEENKTGPRLMELKAINKILSGRGLMIHSIPSDGDCLYNAIKHQLVERGLGSYTVSQLRNMTADYIEKNKDSLIFYMTNPETDEMLDDAGFSKYCELLRSTNAWAGQVEIQSLANIFKVPIEIIQASGPPTVQGSEFKKPSLLITYHRHLYNLGEHYNSTKEQANEDSDEEN